MTVILALFGLAIAGPSIGIGYWLRWYQDRLRAEPPAPHQALQLIYGLGCDGDDWP